MYFVFSLMRGAVCPRRRGVASILSSFLIDWKTEPSFYKHEAFCKNLEGQPCLPPQIPHYIAKAKQSKQYSTVQTETSLDLELVIRQSIVWVKASNGAKFKIKTKRSKTQPTHKPPEQHPLIPKTKTSMFDQSAMLLARPAANLYCMYVWVWLHKAVRIVIDR